MTNKLLIVGEFHVEQVRALFNVLDSKTLRGDFVKDMCAVLVNRLKEANGPEYVKKLSEDDLQELRKEIDKSFELSISRIPSSLIGNFLHDYIELLTDRYRPHVIFTEGSNYTYSIAHDIGIPIVPFEGRPTAYDGQSFLNSLIDKKEDENYEKALIKQITDTTSNYEKTLAVIGSTHLKRVYSEAKKRGLYVERIDCSPPLDFIISLFNLKT